VLLPVSAAMNTQFFLWSVARQRANLSTSAAEAHENFKERIKRYVFVKMGEEKARVVGA
jgi:hypothetical protein